MQISIVIPVYNSEDYIEILVERIIYVLNKIEKSFQIILVDDASADNTWKKLENLYNKYDNIVAIQLTRNFGEYNAVIAGLNYAKGEYVIIMDDDGQNPPEEIPKLIEAAQDSDCDIVYTFYEKKKHSFIRNLGSKFANFCANLVMDKPKDLYLSSFKLIKKIIVEKIIEYKGPYIYIDGLIFYFTKKIKKVKVSHSSRQIGKSNYNLKKLIKVWFNILLNFSIIPLRISLFIGLIVFVIVIIFGLMILIEKLFIHPDIPIGITSIILLVSLSASIQLILLGIFGEYIGRIYLSISNKPQFAVRKKYEK